jgi:hypothetical protein
MLKFIFTLIVIWVLFKIFGNTKVYHFHHTQQRPPEEAYKPDGKITIKKTDDASSKNNKNDDGEFVDYEEIK